MLTKILIAGVVAGVLGTLAVALLEALRKLMAVKRGEVERYHGTAHAGPEN